MTFGMGEFIQVAGIAATLVTGAWALIKVSLAQFQRALTQRFDVMEKAREEGRRLFEERFTRLEDGHVKVSRELLEFKLDVSENRVHRMDYVRGQTVLEAKFDGLATRVENAFLRMRERKE